MAIVKNKYNFREEIFNEEILYKIFNFRFYLRIKRISSQIIYEINYVIIINQR